MRRSILITIVLLCIGVAAVWAATNPEATISNKKIGVGVLKKRDDTRYAFANVYDIIDHGKWSVNQTANSIEFTQELSDKATGYGYLYKKTIRLLDDKPEMVIEHSLKNTGKLPIK